MAADETAAAGMAHRDVLSSADDVTKSDKFSVSSRSIVGWVCLCFAAALWPLLTVDYPGLQDYPNHLARAFVLLNADDPILGRHYRIEWATIPNLGWDLWALAVGRILPLELAGKLFLVTSVAITLFGCFVLNRALSGRWTWVPLLAFPFLFNAAFTKGFLGFELGLGLALCAAAWWLAIGEDRWHIRLAGGIAWSALLYIVHLYSWAIYGTFVLGTKIQSMFQDRDKRPLSEHLKGMLRDGLQILPAAAMAYASTGVVSEPTGQKMGVSEFDPPFDRLKQLDRLIDVGVPWWNEILIFTMGAVFVFALWKRWLQFRTGAVAALVIFASLFFLLPETIEGTYYVSWRIVLAAIFICIASLAPVHISESSSMAPLLAVSLLVTLLTTALLERSWLTSERGREDFLRVIEKIPDGSKIFFAHAGINSDALTGRAVGLYHVDGYAVLAKRALVQSLFSYPGQQLLRYRDLALQIVPESSKMFLTEIDDRFDEADADLENHISRFDYVVIHGPQKGRERRVFGPDRFILTAQSNDFRLYKVGTIAPPDN